MTNPRLSPKRGARGTLCCAFSSWISHIGAKRGLFRYKEAAHREGAGEAVREGQWVDSWLRILVKIRLGKKPETEATKAKSWFKEKDAFVAFSLPDRGMDQTERKPDALELAYGGVFGAAALLLPFLFHLLHLGRVFMPMYIPLVALAFLVRPGISMSVSIMCPLLSGALTGMPPFYPPVAFVMSLELGGMALIIFNLTRRLPRLGSFLVLLVALVLGRILNVAITYFFAMFMELPAGFLAGVSLISGWPGMILMLLVVPSFLRMIKDKNHQGVRWP